MKKFRTERTRRCQLSEEKISKNVDFSLSKNVILAFEANSALSRENETKIVKITHSAAPLPPYIYSEEEVLRAVDGCQLKYKSCRDD